MIRCPWCSGDPLYEAYHDREWGVPVFHDRKQFEFLVLESAQAGLSWLTILKKRENYRRLYCDFDFCKVAEFTESKIEQLLADPGIIRNRLKIKASVNNARRFLEIRAEFNSFSDYLWNFVDHKPVVNHFNSQKEVPAQTHLSQTISRDLKQRGFKFLGPTHHCVCPSSGHRPGKRPFNRLFSFSGNQCPLLKPEKFDFHIFLL